MYISSFQIDGFGIFSNVEVDSLSPGMSIFLGRNEAGKSTCLEFLRAMLTGYPEGKNLRDKYEPVAQTQPGGSLVLCCDNSSKIEKIYLSRRPNRNGGLTLRAENGDMVRPEKLDAIFSGISQDVYRKVFGFSLGELESFETLNEEGVKNALYGASFGPGLRSPAEALKIIRRRKDEIFKPGGARMPLNVAMKELESLRIIIAEKNESSASYDTLCQTRDARKAELAALQSQRENLEMERRILERRLGVWQQWEQWSQLARRLDNMVAESDDFPADGIKRLEQIQASLDACEQDLASCKLKLENLRERRNSLVVDMAVMENAPLLQRLAERKSGYRQALSQIDGQRENCIRAENELAENLAMLGPDWDCKRIRSIDRSLFAREALDKHEDELTNALLTHQAAMDGLDKANNEVSACENSFAAANAALEELPDPEAVMTGPERDELRQNMARLEESRRLEAGREKALQTAKNALGRALEQARIQVGHESALTEARHMLETIRASHDEAVKVAEELRTHTADAREFESNICRLEDDSENLKKKMDSLRDISRNEKGTTRDSLDMKGRALRSLRSLAGRVATAKERLGELDTRLASEPKPVKTLNWSLLIMGLFLLLGGGGLFLAHYFMDFKVINIPDGPAITVNLLEIYILIACGVILLAFGIPSNNEEQKRYQREIAQLQASREMCVMRMVELDTQAKQLCATIGVDSMDPITLDAAEMLLEREKEQFIHDERSWREIELLQKELTDNRVKLSDLQKKSHQKEQDIQKCRRKWQGLMEELRLADCPSPESVSTVFARADAAWLACDNVQNAQNELDALWEDLHLLESSISATPAIAHKLESAQQPLSLEEAVAQTLEACRHADIVWEQRVRAQTALKTVGSELERARKRQDDSARQLKEANEALEKARKAWADTIKDFGLGNSIDPQTMRDALRFMDNCLASEDRLAQAKGELAQSEMELDALARPLGKCLEELGREAVSDSDGKPDWLATLDMLLGDAARGAETINAQKMLDSQITALEDEYGSRAATLDTINARSAALLKQARSENRDDFINRAKAHAEREELRKTLETVEASLRLAAGNEPWEEFLESFTSSSREVQEKQLVEARNGLDEISAKEREAATNLGSLNARIDNIVGAGDLANLRQEESMITESMEKMLAEWCQYAFAEAIILKAKHKFESERQPEVIRMASEIFARITNDKWRGLRTTLEDSHLEILPAHGEPIQPYKLSRGAQEQAYLALRLAYIQNHAAHAMPLPVIMDEILVNFDPERAERTAKAFAGLAQGSAGAQQILYFTCQPHMVDILRAASPDARLYIVENGGISAA